MTTRITKSELRKLIKQSITEQVAGRRWNRDYEEPRAPGEPYGGERSDDSVNRTEYDGTSGFHSKEAEDAYWASRERQLDEQSTKTKSKCEHKWLYVGGHNEIFVCRLCRKERSRLDESGPSQVAKGSTIPEQASEIPLGSKANRPQPGDIFVADNDYHPMFFKVIKPSKSSKYGVVYELAKVAAKAERGVFAPDINSELGSHFHRTFHTGQRAFEIGGDVGVATLWNGEPVKAAGYFNERAELPSAGGVGSQAAAISAPKIGDVFVSQDGKFLKVSQKYKSHRSGAESYMLAPIGSKGDKPALSSFVGAPISATYNPRKKGFEIENGRVPGFATPYKGSTSLYGEGKTIISKKQLQKLIKEAIHEQMHGGDFAAWGDEESPAPAPVDAPAKAEPSTPAVKKGDIFVSKWRRALLGTIQIEFYKVINVGKTGEYVKVAKMSNDIENSQHENYHAVTPGIVTGTSFVRKIHKGSSGNPLISVDNKLNAILWDGKPCLITSDTDH